MASAPIPPLPEGPALAEHPYAAFLSRVQKPGRYIGGEDQQVVKTDPNLVCRFVLAFPDLYEIGMSHLGTRILYDLVNACDDLVCERAFSPWTDMEAQLRSRGLPLCSLETHAPLHAFDVVGVSLQYELSYTNVLLNLELGGIPLRAADRSDADPIVIAGGPTATHPEPIAVCCDALLCGEAEEVLPELLRTVGRLRRAERPRAEILAALCRLPGVYVPAFYRVEADPRTGLQVVVGRTSAGEAAGAPATVGRVWVRDLDKFPFPDRFPVPYAEAIFDRASVEITRGCTEGCRFCQAGIIYRPVRERSPEQIVGAVLRGMDNAGYGETSLTALSTADVSCIDPLIKTLVPELVRRKAKLGVSSLRAYGLSGELLDQVHSVGINGLTFAPEAGTQRMRDVINKNVSEADILQSAERIFSRGYDRMKMYFIMGLPTETEADVHGIVETGCKVRDVARSLGLRRQPKIALSVSQHVPKPHTPFQWAAMDTVESLHGKVALLRERTRRERLNLRTHDVEESWLECLFARGDRRLGEVLLRAYAAGARFDGWKERFSFSIWLDALQAEGIEPDRYTQTLPVDARLPWDHIDIGLEPGFLASEYRKALRDRVSPPCGKPVGAKVHPASVEDSLAQSGKRLVCYDCGIACDMQAMREERVDALRNLKHLRVAAPTMQPATPAAGVVPLERLRGRLPSSNLPTGNAWKTAAEAPHSRLRLWFAKQGPLRFQGHLDLLRVFPRMFRRAGIELAYTRGYNPVPRMTFAPAIPLGMTAHAEIVDVDVLLSQSLRDMTGEWSEDARGVEAAGLLDALRNAAPPGLGLLRALLLPAQAPRLGKQIAAAEYAVRLTEAQARSLAPHLAARLQADPLQVERAVPRNKGRGKSRKSSQTVSKVIDVRTNLIDASLEAETLRFRLDLSTEGGARPREVVEALLGERVDDHCFERLGLLTRMDERLVPM